MFFLYASFLPGGAVRFGHVVTREMIVVAEEEVSRVDSWSGIVRTVQMCKTGEMVLVD